MGSTGIHVMRQKFTILLNDSWLVIWFLLLRGWAPNTARKVQSANLVSDAVLIGLLVMKSYQNLKFDF